MSSINSAFPFVSPPTALNSGLTTISAGFQQINQDAQQIANPDQSSTNALLDLSQASLLSQAGADVIRASNNMLGSLFDAFA
jgi:hypothetical protein